jgi:hypothetical protein
MKWIDAYIRFTLRTFVWGAHGAALIGFVVTPLMVRDGEFGAALTFGIIEAVLIIGLIIWWRKHLRPTSQQPEISN